MALEDLPGDVIVKIADAIDLWALNLRCTCLGFQHHIPMTLAHKTACYLVRTFDPALIGHPANIWMSEAKQISVQMLRCPGKTDDEISELTGIAATSIERLNAILEDNYDGLAVARSYHARIAALYMMKRTKQYHAQRAVRYILDEVFVPTFVGGAFNRPLQLSPYNQFDATAFDSQLEQWRPLLDLDTKNWLSTAMMPHATPAVLSTWFHCQRVNLLAEACISANHKAVRILLKHGANPYKYIEFEEDETVDTVNHHDPRPPYFRCAYTLTRQAILEVGMGDFFTDESVEGIDEYHSQLLEVLDMLTEKKCDIMWMRDVIAYTTSDDWLESWYEANPDVSPETGIKAHPEAGLHISLKRGDGRFKKWINATIEVAYEHSDTDVRAYGVNPLASSGRKALRRLLYRTWQVFYAPHTNSPPSA